MNKLRRKWLGELAVRRIDLISESGRVGILNCEKSESGKGAIYSLEEAKRLETANDVAKRK